MLVRWICCLTLVSVAVSCQGSSDDAELIGQLFGDPSIPCVWIGDSSGGIEVDWPGLVDVDESSITVSGPGFEAEEGDWFRMTGGTRREVAVTEGCPVTEPEGGRFVAGAIEYLGDQPPP